MKKIVMIIAVLTLILTGCGGGISQADYDKIVSERDALKAQLENLDVSEPQQGAEPKGESQGEQAENSDGKELSFGDTFEFDELEMTFGDDIVWITDNDGVDIFGVPVTVKNLKSETHRLNTLYCSQYGTKGTELNSTSMFLDNSVEIMGDMRTGASNEAIMYFYYDGDGDYYVEFDDWSNKTEIKIPVVK